MMRLVEVNEIPSMAEVKDVSTDNLVEIFKIAKEMEALCLKENGIGLSAVQVGIPLKLFVVRIDNKHKFGNNGFFCFCNMDYRPFAEGVIISLEGCLSIRSPSGQLRHFQVPRYREIVLNGYRLDYDGTDLKLQNLDNFRLSLEDQSIVFQHEIDHQNGILISDIGKEVFLW